MDDKEYSLLLSRLAMLGIVEDEGLRKIINEGLNKAGEKKVQIWDIMDSFLDKKAEGWPI